MFRLALQSDREKAMYYLSRQGCRVRCSGTSQEDQPDIQRSPCCVTLCTPGKGFSSGIKAAAPLAPASLANRKAKSLQMGGWRGREGKAKSLNVFTLQGTTEMCFNFAWSGLAACAAPGAVLWPGGAMEPRPWVQRQRWQRWQQWQQSQQWQRPAPGRDKPSIWQGLLWDTQTRNQPPLPIFSTVCCILPYLLPVLGTHKPQFGRLYSVAGPWVMADLTWDNMRNEEC